MAAANKTLIARQLAGHLYIEVAKIYGIPESLFDGIIPVRPELAWENQESATEKILQDVDQTLRDHPKKPPASESTNSSIIWQNEPSSTKIPPPSNTG